MHIVSSLFAFGIGAGALYAFKSSRSTRTEMLDWPSVHGQITDRTIERRRSMSNKGSGWVYTPALRYAYSVDGIDHTGDTREAQWSTGTIKAIAKWRLDKIPDAVPVLYDPADPAKSTLTPPGRGDVWFWAVAGVALIAFGVFLLFS